MNILADGRVYPCVCFVDTGDWFSLDPRCSGDPVAQGFISVCFMLREDVTTRAQSGFAEAISADPATR